MKSVKQPVGLKVKTVAEFKAELIKAVETAKEKSPSFKVVKDLQDRLIDVCRLNKPSDSARKQLIKLLSQVAVYRFYPFFLKRATPASDIARYEKECMIAVQIELNLMLVL